VKLRFKTLYTNGEGGQRFKTQKDVKYLNSFMSLNPAEGLYLLFFMPYLVNVKSDKETAKDMYV
jgi:hypothetical protein